MCFNGSEKSTKVYVDREGETLALKRLNVGGGGDSRVTGVCVMFNAAGIAVNVLLSEPTDF